MSDMISADEARAWRDDGVDGTREEIALLCDSVIAQATEIDRLTAERDAYRRAKQENDERFMRERDEAREGLAAARAALAWYDGHSVHHCDACQRLATRITGDGLCLACDDHADCGGACSPACVGPCSAWTDLPHAAAIRAARGAR